MQCIYIASLLMCNIYLTWKTPLLVREGGLDYVPRLTESLNMF